jgi:hypothetical protein
MTNVSKRVRLIPSAAAERRAGERELDNTSRPLVDRVEARQQWHDLRVRPRDMGKHRKNSKHKKGPHLVIPGDGDPCPRCGRPMQIREHRRITAKHRRQPLHFSRWFCCMHDDCKTLTVTPLRYAVWHCSGEKRRNIEATLLAKGLAREREKEVAEAKARGEVVWGDRWPDD